MLFRISGVDSRGLKTLIKPTTLSPFWKWKWRSSKKSKINLSKISVCKTTKNSQKVGILKWQDAPTVNKAGVGSKLSKNNKSYHYSLRILHFAHSIQISSFKLCHKVCTKLADEMSRTLEMNHILSYCLFLICHTKTSVKFSYILV